MSLQTCFNSFRSRSAMQLAQCLCLQICRCPQGNYSRSPNSQAKRYTERQGDRRWGRQTVRLNEVKSPSCAASWPTACGFYAYTVKIKCVSLLFTESFQDHSELHLIQTCHWNVAVLQSTGVPTAGGAFFCRLKGQHTPLVQTKTEDPQFCETWNASVLTFKSSTTNTIKMTFVNKLATAFAIPLYSATSTSCRCHCCLISFFHYTKKDSINTTFITLPLELYSPSETS